MSEQECDTVFKKIKTPYGDGYRLSDIQKMVETIEAQAKEIEELKIKCFRAVELGVQINAVNKELERLKNENKELKESRLKSSFRAVDEGRTFERDLIE